jgi:hypothetical protein
MRKLNGIHPILQDLVRRGKLVFVKNSEPELRDDRWARVVRKKIERKEKEERESWAAAVGWCWASGA